MTADNVRAGARLDRQVDTLAELGELTAQFDELFVRYSEGPDDDRGSGSIDTESGLELPGLSVNPLTPEAWWSRPLTDWLARQVCQYRDLAERNPDRFAWALTGRVIGRGPDCEPLIVAAQPIARLSPALLEEAGVVYESHFDAGRGPGDPG